MSRSASKWPCDLEPITSPMESIVPCVGQLGMACMYYFKAPSADWNLKPVCLTNMREKKEEQTAEQELSMDYYHCQN